VIYEKPPPRPTRADIARNLDKNERKMRDIVTRFEESGIAVETRAQLLLICNSMFNMLLRAGLR
jgi:hypothetical protein